MSEWSIAKKQGRTPPSLTPDTLRKWAQDLEWQPNPDPFSVAMAHADAWEAEREQHRKEVAYEGRENVYLRGRLEAERDNCTCGARTAVPHNPWCREADDG